MSAATLVITIVLGVVGAVLSWLQTLNALFLPRLVVLIERDLAALPQHRRAVVRITNRGGAPGMIRSVDIATAQRVLLGGVSVAPLRAVEAVGWSGPGPFPFYLPARGTAVIVFSAPDGGAELSVTDCVRMEYGVDKRRTAYFDTLPGRIAETTSLPPDSLAVHAAPTPHPPAGAPDRPPQPTPRQPPATGTAAEGQASASI